jgi:hypothetical protein
MRRLRLALSISCAAVLAGCSGRAGDSVDGCGELGACPASPDPGCACVAVDAAALDAPADAQTDPVPAPDAWQDAGAPSADAAVVDAPSADALVEASVVEASSAPEGASDLPDAASDASLGCYLQGYIYCPVDTWCPLGTCPDGITPYGCTCNPDGSTTCTLDCPN